MMEPANGGSAAVQLSVGVAQGVWKAFGETQALRDVSLDVGAGECHGLVGRNGAGKSTLVAIFTGKSSIPSATSAASDRITTILNT